MASTGGAGCGASTPTQVDGHARYPQAAPAGRPSATRHLFGAQPARCPDGRRTLSSTPGSSGAVPATRAAHGSRHGQIPGGIARCTNRRPQIHHGLRIVSRACRASSRHAPSSRTRRRAAVWMSCSLAMTRSTLPSTTTATSPNTNRSDGRGGVGTNRGVRCRRGWECSAAISHAMQAHFSKLRARASIQSRLSTQRRHLAAADGAPSAKVS